MSNEQTTALEPLSSDDFTNAMMNAESDEERCLIGWRQIFAHEGTDHLTWDSDRVTFESPSRNLGVSRERPITKEQIQQMREHLARWALRKA